MKIENLLKTVELPAIYKREDKDCYYDTYRKKLIQITPEETVRQKVAALFEQQYDVPKDMIALEVPMSHYVKGASGMAIAFPDILCFALLSFYCDLYFLSAFLSKMSQKGKPTNCDFSQVHRFCVLSQIYGVISSQFLWQANFLFCSISR